MTLIVVVGALAASRFVIAHRSGELNQAICEGTCPGEYVEPPVPLGLMPQPTLPDSPDPAESQIDLDAVRKAVDSALSHDDLGKSVGFAAAGTDGKQTTSGPKTLTPASTTKLLTVFAALTVMDHDRRFTTSVVAPDESTIVLVGDGDPFLDVKKAKKPEYAHVATLRKLAKKTAAQLKKAGRTKVSLGWDDSKFAGKAWNSTWPARYKKTGKVAPVTALNVSHRVNGVPRPSDPAADAADKFAKQLKKRGIKVTSKSRERDASGSTVARANSATLRQIVTGLLLHSDNDAAEALLRHVAIAKGEKPTFKGGLKVVRKVLKSQDISMPGLKLRDGSGLSYGNRIAPRTLVELLQRADDDSNTASLLTSTPAGAFSGTLSDRFDDAKAARGRVHAKTGTLDGVTALAGTVVDANGSVIFFAVMADDVTAGFQAGKDAEGKVAAALARCRCS